VGRVESMWRRVFDFGEDRTPKLFIVDERH
jgi:hypothetical protein